MKIAKVIRIVSQLDDILEENSLIKDDKNKKIIKPLTSRVCL